MPRRGAAACPREARAEQAGASGQPRPGTGACRIRCAWRWPAGASTTLRRRIDRGHRIGWPDRDALLSDMRAAGLAGPDRLRDEYERAAAASAARAELERRQRGGRRLRRGPERARRRPLAGRAGRPAGRRGPGGHAGPRRGSLFAEGDLVGAAELVSVRARPPAAWPRPDGAGAAASAVLVLVGVLLMIWLVRRHAASGGWHGPLHCSPMTRTQPRALSLPDRRPTSCPATPLTSTSSGRGGSWPPSSWIRW